MVPKDQGMTCKSCYWYAVCWEHDRMYPCKDFDSIYEKKGSEPDGQAEAQDTWRTPRSGKGFASAGGDDAAEGSVALGDTSRDHGRP